MGNNRINQQQTPIERKTKYQFLRLCGCDFKTSRALRDWGKNKIIIFLNNERITKNKRTIKKCLQKKQDKKD